MAGFWNDLRCALRGLMRQPLLVLTVVLTMGLGIGVNSTVFSLVNSVLFKPLPVAGVDRLVNLYSTRPDGSGTNPISLPEFRDLVESQTVFDGVVGFGAFLGALAGPPSETVFGEMVTADYFRVLGLEASAGRLLDTRDAGPGATATAVISQRLWRVRFAGRSDIVGSSALINGRNFTIVGVAPPSFSGLLARGVPIDVWVGFSQLDFMRHNSGDRGNRWLHVKARLRPEIEFGQAEAFVNSLAGNLQRQFPQFSQGRRLRLYRTGDVILNPEGDGPVFLVSALLTGAVALLLLVICANLANLFLARSFSRIRDYSIRRTLGASYPELIRQPLLEALLLSLAGGILGLGVAVWCSSFLDRFTPPLPVPLHFDLGVDFRVVLFSVALSILVGSLLGLACAANVRRMRGSTLLREGDWSTAGRTQRRWSRYLLIPQLSFAVLILVVAGLFVRSVRLASGVDPGFNTSDTAMAGVELRLAGYEPAEAAQFLAGVKAHLDEEPGIASSAITSWIPAGALFGRSSTTVWLETGRREIQNGRVGMDFLATLEIPVLEGRDFVSSDFESQVPVAIVSQSAARALWPGAPALGQRLRVGSEEGPWHEVVGVTRDAKVQTLGEEPEPFLFTPLRDRQASLTMLVARSRGGNQGLVELLRGSITESDPNVAVFDAISFQDHVAILVYPFRMAARVGSFLGLATLALVVIGLYGLVALSVSHRLRELGIRMALGARPRHLAGLLLREVSGLVLGSVVLGLAASVGASRVLEDLVFGIGARDPQTFLLVPGVLSLVALLASAVPLRKALRADPVRILRSN